MCQVPGYNHRIDRFDALVQRFTQLFAQMQRDHGLPKTAPELSAISLAFFIMNTVIRATPFGQVCLADKTQSDSTIDILTQLQTVATTASQQLREMAEQRISEATPQEQRANVIKLMNTLLLAYPTFRDIRTKDCIQIIEGFENHRVSVTNPKEILFGTFECWEPLVNAIDEETNRLQRDGLSERKGLL